MAKDFGRDLDIGMPRDEALNVRVSIDEAIGDALNEKVTTELSETNLRLKRIEALTGFNLGITSNEEVT